MLADGNTGGWATKGGRPHAGRPPLRGRLGALVRFALALGVLVSAVAASGCGGGGRDDAAFVARADVLCEKAAAALPPRPDVAGAAPISRFVRFIDLTGDDLDPLVRGLGKLDPPTKVAREMRLYVENLSYMNVLALRAMEATHDGRYADGLKFVRAFSSLAAENAPLADRIGFRVCGPEGPPKPRGSLISGLELTAA